jgi:hypothetical protein
MINLRKLRQIEKHLEAELKPEPYKYLKLSDNRLLLIEPGKIGMKTVIEFIYEGEEHTTGKRFNNIEELKNEFPNQVLYDASNEIEKQQKRILELFV